MSEDLEWWWWWWWKVGLLLLFDTVDKITRRPVRVRMRHMFHALSMFYLCEHFPVSVSTGLIGAEEARQKKTGDDGRGEEDKGKEGGKKEKKRKKRKKNRRNYKKTYICIATPVRCVALSIDP